MILCHGNAENCRLCRWKTHSQPMEKDGPFPQVCKQVSHNNAGSGSLRTFPQRLLLQIHWQEVLKLYKLLYLLPNIWYNYFVERPQTEIITNC